jgi:hypothetical protein
MWCDTRRRVAGQLPDGLDRHRPGEQEALTLLASELAQPLPLLGLLEALGLEAGDRVYFQVHTGGAVLSKVPDFLDLAGRAPHLAGEG